MMKTHNKKKMPEKPSRNLREPFPLRKMAMYVLLLAFAFGPSVSPNIARAQAGTNLIPNPSVETGTTAPNSWNRGRFGKNAVTFTYPATGIDGRAVRIDMTKHKSGDAKWYFDDVPVKPGTQYIFSDSSISDVMTSVDARYTVPRNTPRNPNAGRKTKFRYVKLGDVPAASTPTVRQFTFTTPKNATSLTIFHLIDSVGYLTTDNYSLVEVGAGGTTSDIIVPTVSITSPLNGATVSGVVTISATATDNVGMTGVRAVHSGVNHSDIPIGAEDTVAPYSFEWNTVGVANGVHQLEAMARDAAGNIGTSTVISVTVNNVAQGADTVAPTVSITSPLDGATVSGTTTVSVTSADNVAVASNTLFIDGVSTASLGTSSPATFSWNTVPLADGVHTLYAVAMDATGNMATSSAISVTVTN